MEKLTQIQKELKAPKNQFNAFGKYNYRNCEDILEALKPLMDGCNLTISDEIVMIGNRFYVKATARFGDKEKIVEVSAYAREEESKKGMDGAQVTGAASSYARKYALNGLFLIDDTKDSDSTNKHGKENTIQTSAPPPESATTGQPEAKEPEPADNVIFQKITSVDSKDGETKGKKWKVFFISTATGDKYGTFDTKIADLATTFQKSGELAKIQWKQGNKSNTKEIIGIGF